MAKCYNLDHMMPSVYGEENYTIRQAIENGIAEPVVKRDMWNMFKNEYFVQVGILSIRVNGNQLKKYLRSEDD